MPVMKVPKFISITALFDGEYNKHDPALTQRGCTPSNLTETLKITLRRGSLPEVMKGENNIGFPVPDQQGG